MMRSVYIVVNVGDGQVDRPIFVVAGCNQYSCLVATKYNQYKHCTICLGVFHKHPVAVSVVNNK